MLSNAYFLAKFRFDTAENEPAKNLQNSRKMHSSKMHFRAKALRYLRGRRFGGQGSGSDREQGRGARRAVPLLKPMEYIIKVKNLVYDLFFRRDALKEQFGNDQTRSMTCYIFKKTRIALSACSRSAS